MGIYPRRFAHLCLHQKGMVPRGSHVSVSVEQWRSLFGVWITHFFSWLAKHIVWHGHMVRESAWAASARNRTHFPTHIHAFHFSFLLFSFFPFFSLPSPPLFLFQKASIQVAPRAACVVELFSCRAAISWQQLVGELGSRSGGDLSAVGLAQCHGNSWNGWEWCTQEIFLGPLHSAGRGWIAAVLLMSFIHLQWSQQLKAILSTWIIQNI